MTSLHKRLIWICVIAFMLLMLKPHPKPDGALKAFKKGQTAMLFSQFIPARTAFLEALKRMPYWQAAQLAQFQAALYTGEQDLLSDALTHFQDPAVDSQCAEVSIQLATGNLEAVLQILTRADSHCSQRDAILDSIVHAAYHSDRPRLAIQALQLMNPQVQRDLTQLQQLGLLMATCAPEDAIPLLQLSLEIQPSDDKLYTDLINTIEESRAADTPAYSLARVGQVFTHYERWDYAKWAFEEALQLDPLYGEALAYLGLAKDHTHLNGITELQQAVEIIPDSALPHLFLAYHWIDRQEWPYAEQALKRAFVLDGQNPAIAVLFGEVYARQGQFSAARSAYIRATELAPENPHFWLTLAFFSINYRIEISDLAITAAQNALTLDPDNPEALDALGYAYFLEEDYLLAETTLMQALETDPPLASACYHLGLLRLSQTRLEEGIILLKQAAALDTTGRIKILAERSLEQLTD